MRRNFNPTVTAVAGPYQRDQRFQRSKEGLMITKSLLASMAFTLASLTSSSPSAHAQAPSLSGNVWTPPVLSFNDCMQKAARAISQAGGNITGQQTVFAGLGVVMGGFGDYSALITCMTFKGAVTFTVAGLDFATADNYRKQLNTIMTNPN